MKIIIPKINKGVQVSKKVKAIAALALFAFVIIIVIIVKTTSPNIQQQSASETPPPSANTQLAKIEMTNGRQVGGLSTVAPANPSPNAAGADISASMLDLPPGAASTTGSQANNAGLQGGSGLASQNSSGIGSANQSPYQQALQTGKASGLSPSEFASDSSSPGGQSSSGGSAGGSNALSPSDSSQGSGALAAPGNDYGAQNNQDEKQGFMNSQPKSNDALSVGIQNPISKLEVSAGSIIPSILETGINSDLPGQITARVRENVYDSITHNNILIPQGSQLIGMYDSSISYGQSRVLIVWNRVLFPNGQYIDLEGMPGADLSGYSGLSDQVNNHYVRIFGSALLMSLFSAGAQLSQPQSSNDSNSAPTSGQIIAAAMGQNISNAATQMISKNLNIQPTIMIRPGEPFNVLVTRDIPFKQAYLGDNSSVPSQSGF